MQQRTIIAYVLYRHFGRDGSLLYVGAAGNPFVRLGAHRNSAWFDDVATITLEHYSDAESLRAAENTAIKREGPKYNISLNGSMRNAGWARIGALYSFEHACRKWLRHLRGQERVEAVKIAMKLGGLKEIPQLPWDEVLAVGMQRIEDRL